MTYLLAIGSNFQRQQALETVVCALQQLGTTHYSPTYQLPCRDGIGEDYWNLLATLDCELDQIQLKQRLSSIENRTGRIRSSHQISLDIDLIAKKNNQSRWFFFYKQPQLPLDISLLLQYQDWY